MRLHGICAVNVTKKHCQNGHLLAGDNVYQRPAKRPGRECRACRRERLRTWRRTNHEAAIAVSMLGYAKRNGEIKEATACENCRGVGPLEAHHHKGYKRENWLNVRWLCIPCHVAAH